MKPLKASRQQQARLRAEMIVKVQSGVVTASQAARQLGVSRRTYYKWQNRGLREMIRALTEQPAGRPDRPVDSEKEQLRQENESLRREKILLEQKLSVRRAMQSEKPRTGSSAAGKKGGEPGNDRRANDPDQERAGHPVHGAVPER